MQDPTQGLTLPIDQQLQSGDSENLFNSDDDQSDDENDINEQMIVKTLKKKKLSKKNEGVQSQQDDIYDDQLHLDKLPKKLGELENLLSIVQGKIGIYTQKFLKQQSENQTKKSFVTDNSIPICTDIRTFDFELLRAKQLEIGQHLFDIIMMDPPWKLSSSNPSRGVAIQYDSLSDDIISKIPVPRLQTQGFLCIWTINAKYRISCKLMNAWGYKLVDEISWVKKTVNGKIAKGHGFYLQHAKQSCLIGVKGNVDMSRFHSNIASDIIFSERRGQSQKPTQMYEIFEKLVPNGFYLQIFGRRNNLRDRWVTVGNEL